MVKEHNFIRTLILTHRPVVDKGWFEDFGKFYDTPVFSYGSKNQGNQFTTLGGCKEIQIHLFCFHTGLQF